MSRARVKTTAGFSVLEQKLLRAQGSGERQGLSTPLSSNSSSVVHRHKRCSVSSGYCCVRFAGRSRRDREMKRTQRTNGGTDGRMTRSAAGVPGVPGVSSPGAGRLFRTISPSHCFFWGVSRVSRRISKTIAHTHTHPHAHPHARSGLEFSPGHPGHPRCRRGKAGEGRFSRRLRCPTPGRDTPRTPQDTPGVGGEI